MARKAFLTVSYAGMCRLVALRRTDEASGRCTARAAWSAASPAFGAPASARRWGLHVEDII